MAIIGAKRLSTSNLIALNGLTLALDVMGGDFGPSVTLPAARMALQHFPELHLLLFGHSEKINAFLASLEPELAQRAECCPCQQVVSMAERPAHALRSKPDSSMRKAVEAVADGAADACVSAGNTGALMAISRQVLRSLPGIDRPALVSTLPTVDGGKVHMLDLGANLDCSSDTLFQFALMGAVLAEQIEGITAPAVALLNIGSEANKGNDQIKQAAQLLTDCPQINYMGYIEGNELFLSRTDVVVCDGFVGNICLKTCEGLTQLFLGQLAGVKQRGNWWQRLQSRLLASSVKRFTARMNPDQYNGASLLGLRAIVVKSHGHADAKAFYNALVQAISEVRRQVPSRISESVEAVMLGRVD